MIKFLKSSWIYLLAGALIFVYSFAKQGEGLSPKEFAKKIKETTNAQVVDVRTPEEFAGGYIADAKNIDWNNDNFDKKISNLDKDKPTFVYCQSGNRSGSAAKRMKEMGFTNVYELSGGIRAWRSADLPLQTVKKASGMNMSGYQQLLDDKRPVLVDIYAKWCSPCKKMAPFLDELTTSEASWLKIVRIDADKNIALADELKVTGLPTLYLYINGKEVWNYSGYISKAELLEQIKKHT